MGWLRNLRSRKDTSQQNAPSGPAAVDWIKNNLDINLTPEQTELLRSLYGPTTAERRTQVR